MYLLLTVVVILWLGDAWVTFYFTCQLWLAPSILMAKSRRRGPPKTTRLIRPNYFADGPSCKFLKGGRYRFERDIRIYPCASPKC